MLLIVTNLLADDKKDIHLQQCNATLFDCYDVVIGATDPQIDPYGEFRTTWFNLTVDVLLENGSVAQKGTLKVITSNNWRADSDSSTVDINKNHTRFKLKYGAYKAYYVLNGTQTRLSPKLYSTIDMNNGTLQTLEPYVPTNYTMSVQVFGPDGNPLRGMDVKFISFKKKMCDTQTDAGGIATCTSFYQFEEYQVFISDPNGDYGYVEEEITSPEPYQIKMGYWSNITIYGSVSYPVGNFCGNLTY